MIALIWQRGETPGGGIAAGNNPRAGRHPGARPAQRPDAGKLNGKRDRAILSTLLYHGIRREELATLKVKDYNQIRRSVALCG